MKTTGIYIRSTSTTFKDRYRIHKITFNNKQKRYSTDSDRITINKLMRIKRQKHNLQLNLGKYYVEQKQNSNNTCKQNSNNTRKICS